MSRYLTLVILCGLVANDPLRGQPPGLERDLHLPEVVTGAPLAGKRVKQTDAQLAHTAIYHLLYLPTDWTPGKKYPVIAEYAGNRYQTSPGTVEGSHLGYGISAGSGVIWVCLPYVNSQERRNEHTWWGDVQATLDYCRRTLEHICRAYGGDRDRLFVAGFSRGAIACNFLGLHDDEIASMWRGFICHSHYDGVRRWGYEGSDRESALRRLQRLRGRPQFISHEGSTGAVQSYLRQAGVDGAFTFCDLPGWGHTDTWVLYSTPQREQLRAWFRQVCDARKIPGRGPEKKAASAMP